MTEWSGASAQTQALPTCIRDPTAINRQGCAVDESASFRICKECDRLGEGHQGLRSAPGVPTGDRADPPKMPRPDAPGANPASGGCQGGNWCKQCEQEPKRDIPFPTQGQITNCVQRKWAACGYLVPK